MDDYCYVYATLKANTAKVNVPVICFCSHMDTSPDSSGKNVKPIIHRNYQGADITLPDDVKQVITTAHHPKLLNQIGNDVVTASGTTLLGADNKAGITAIMTSVDYLLQHPEIKHGDIRILFTPDEEIGRGVDKVDMKKLGADFGYTIDGEEKGSMEDETFSADALSIKIHGVSAHPGFAKGKLVNAIKIAGDIINQLPTEGAPESTSGREGFVHPVRVHGGAEMTQIDFIIRDFKTALLKEKEDMIESIVQDVMKLYPKATAEVIVKEQYRNMKEVLDQHPQVASFAGRAIKEAGLTLINNAIRGGTDGSRLSFMGLPCPNIFAGEHAFHSKHEWVSLQDMAKSAEVIIRLANIWEMES
ncbi:UNVERIFIED_CONTAM: hypothetical protein GTU68_043985 [Idotea baltica]|nr:hypothetical protein [Idotea baltica]